MIKPRSDGKVLFCLTYQWFDESRKVWDVRFEYTHAHSAAAVINAFGRALPRGRVVGRNVIIVGTAPAIGVFKDPSKAGRVTVD